MKPRKLLQVELRNLWDLWDPSSLSYISYGSIILLYVASVRPGSKPPGRWRGDFGYLVKLFVPESHGPLHTIRVKSTREKGTENHPTTWRDGWVRLLDTQSIKLLQNVPQRIHGTGVFTYMKAIISAYKYTTPRILWV